MYKEEQDIVTTRSIINIYDYYKIQDKDNYGCLRFLDILKMIQQNLPYDLDKCGDIDINIPMMNPNFMKKKQKQFYLNIIYVL